MMTDNNAMYNESLRIYKNNIDLIIGYLELKVNKEDGLLDELKNVLTDSMKSQWNIYSKLLDRPEISRLVPLVYHYTLFYAIVSSFVTILDIDGLMELENWHLDTVNSSEYQVCAAQMYFKDLSSAMVKSLQMIFNIQSENTMVIQYSLN